MDLIAMVSISTLHIHSCFGIRGEGGVGTAFGIETPDRWLVTAKHNLGAAVSGNNILFKTQGGWVPHRISKIRGHETRDVAIFKIDDLKVPFPPADHEQEVNPMFGQDTKFLGFPHGLENTYDSPYGYSSPLVRNAFLSGAVHYEGDTMLILDGFNNPGYSGSPVWYAGSERTKLYLLGIVSGYRVEEKSKSKVYRDGGEGRESIVEELFVKPNSGMIHSVPYKALSEILSL